MNIQSKVAIGTMASCFLLLAEHPDSALAGAGLICAIVLFGFLEFMEQRGLSQIDELRQHVIKSEIDQEVRIKAIKDRLEAMMIGRGVAR